MPEQVRGRGFKGIATDRPLLNVDPGQVGYPGYQLGDLFIRELGLERDAVKSPCLGSGPSKPRDLRGTQADGIADLLKRGVEVVYLKRLDLQREAGIVACEHGAIAIENSAAWSLDRQQGHAIFIRTRCMVFVLPDL